MREVRAHSLGDIEAYLTVLQQEQRAQRMKASGKAAKGRR